MVLGDRAALGVPGSQTAAALRAIAPEVVTDTIAATEADSQATVQAFRGPFTGGECRASRASVEPRFVCEVEFTEWTSRTGQLRHPSFKGLRPDRNPRAVAREG